MFALVITGAVDRLTVKTKVAFAAPEALVALKVILEVPAVVGVPVMPPAGARVRPAGSAPTVTDQVLPPLPPLAARVC